MQGAASQLQISAPRLRLQRGRERVKPPGPLHCQPGLPEKNHMLRSRRLFKTQASGHIRHRQRRALHCPLACIALHTASFPAK